MKWEVAVEFIETWSGIAPAKRFAVSNVTDFDVN